MTIPRAWTPGPWQIKSDFEPTIVIANLDGESFSDGTSRYTYDFICDTAVDEFGGHIDSQTTHANARLIAKAPALFETLRNVREACLVDPSSDKVSIPDDLFDELCVVLNSVEPAP